MGMAEEGKRDRKQRIGIDPQNTNWANDKSKVGFKMLEKMGWTDGKGLGANEDGNAKHISVVFKKDQTGIGAVRKNIDNWIEHSASYDSLLKNLNAEVASSKPSTPLVISAPTLASTPTESLATPESTEATAIPIHSRMYHRQKYINSKRVSSYNSTDMDAIFGVKSSAPALNLSTPASEDTKTFIESSNIVKTSVSVTDYFAEKLKARAALLNATNESGDVVVCEKREREEDAVEVISSKKSKSDGIEKIESKAERRLRKELKRADKIERKAAKEIRRQKKESKIE